MHSMSCLWFCGCLTSVLSLNMCCCICVVIGQSHRACFPPSGHDFLMYHGYNNMQSGLGARQRERGSVFTWKAEIEKVFKRLKPAEWRLCVYPDVWFICECLHVDFELLHWNYSFTLINVSPTVLNPLYKFGKPSKKQSVVYSWILSF